MAATMQPASHPAQEAGQRPARGRATAHPRAIRTIVVPLDGSTLAETALDPATELAKLLGAAVVFVRVPVPARVPGLDAVSAYQVGEGDAERSLRAATLRARDNGVHASGLLVTGSLATPAAAILTAVRERHGDLVVMATHGRTGVRRAVLGSVADAVIRDSPVPVILVRAPSPRAALADGKRSAPATSPQASPARPLLVVALDGSPEAEAALEPAANLAQQLDGDVELVRVLDRGGADLLATRDDTSRDVNVEAYLRDACRRLASAPTSLAPQRVHTASPSALSGSVAETLLSHATDRGASFLVLATHARKGVERLLRGSVEAAVVARAMLPVVVVRAAKDTRAAQEPGPAAR